jgi:hypothetical protein
MKVKKLSVGIRIGITLLSLSVTLNFGTEVEALSAGTHIRSGQREAGVSGDSATHVLFIGNSLTYTNDLPKTLEDIATLGNHAVRCASVTRPGFALIDHLDGGSDAVDVIRRGGWQYVILQQGPSSLPESRVILIDGTVRFDVEIRAIGAVTSLYMVWPDLSRFAYFEDVRLNYKAAADTVGGLFLPAGEAWLTAWDNEPSLALYGGDDFHPSPLGTFLVALVMYERITGSDARELPPIAVVAGDTLSVSEQTVRLLQASAHTTNSRYLITGAEDLKPSNDIPMNSEMNQNYPNPFNPSTTISYRLPTLSDVRLRVFDALGREVATLVDGVVQPGINTVVFDAHNLAGGVYYYQLQTRTYVETKKLILLK